jgi:hypothetical protein
MNRREARGDQPVDTLRPNIATKKGPARQVSRRPKSSELGELTR